MAKTIQKQTGPKSIAGKKIVAKNARKGNIFTKGYLPSEDITEKQIEFELMCEQWQAYDPSRQLVLRTIEQASLGLERMMAVEKIKIEAAMQSLDIAQKFAARAGLGVMYGSTLPAWFFMEDDGSQKQHAIYLDLVWQQANTLREKFSDQIVPHIREYFPDLHHFIMHKQSSNASFLMVLGQRYQKSAVTLNLAELMNSIGTKHADHLIWARDPARYQLIINGIRAEQMYEVMDFERSNRFATSFQNRIFKGYQALSFFSQLETQDPQVIESAGLPILVLDEPQADSESKEDETKDVVAEKVA